MASIISSIQHSIQNLGLSQPAKGSALLLGAGFVCRPTVQVLSDAGIKVTVACRTLTSAQKLCAGIANAHPATLDVNDEQALDEAVAANDVAISLIPYTFHAKVIESAIRNKKHVVTTSYVSPAMQALDAAAKEAGITVMNEIGVDPGIDHLYAVKTISDVHARGGKVLSFLSYCGGLPAPGPDADNPLGYKFSWSSRGVLLALRNQAKYYQDGQIIDVSGPQLMGVAKHYHIYPGMSFVAYPNRDSTPYRERYNIPEAQTIIRGTLRYDGFPQFIKVLVDIGFLSDEPVESLATSNSDPPTWAETTARVVGATSPGEPDLLWAISSKTTFHDSAEKERIVAGLKWIGMFSDEKITPRDNPLDTLCARLEQKMQFEEGERDFLMLQHRFEVEEKDGSKKTITSTLVEYGEPTGPGSTSAMAKLVGVPCGVAVKLVLDGTISRRGVIAPMDSEINDPLIKELREQYGIECKEKVVL